MSNIEGENSLFQVTHKGNAFLSTIIFRSNYNVICIFTHVVMKVYTCFKFVYRG